MECNKRNFVVVSIILASVILIYEKGSKLSFQASSTTLYNPNKTNLSSSNFFTIQNVQPSLDMSTYILTDRDLLYKNRSQVVRQGCEKLRKMINRKSSVSNLLVDTVHNIYYCPIPKVGSTFWKRILTVFSSKGRLKSPYDITLRGVKLKQTKIWRKNQIQDWEENESFIFVREPYARLFSGYENKIYHPNKSFWKKIGAKIVNKYRNLTKKVEFGYDVTFPELVREIVDTHEKGGSINGHFTLMSEHCNPCQTDFKYIGHLETIADDSEYLLTRWRHKFNDVTLKFNDLHKEAGYDTARGHVRDLFATHSIIPETFPFRNMMLRTWRDLQMRGYISKYTEFPYTGDINNVTSEEFMQQMKYTISKAQNRTALKLQRHEALVQAYSQVPIKDMERLRQYLLPDCLLFGYDDRPAALFNRSKPLNVDFLYLDGLTSDTKE